LEPRYERFDSEAQYRAAIDSVLSEARVSVDIFDSDLTRMQLGTPERMALLTNFLTTNVAPQLRIVIRDRDGSIDIVRRLPRLMDLLDRYSHLFAIRQAPENLLHLADCHVIGDATHCARRFHEDHARGALISHDVAEVLPWAKRFAELWDLSKPWSGGKRLVL
jgi:hypothetical protein